MATIASAVTVLPYSTTRNDRLHPTTAPEHGVRQRLNIPEITSPGNRSPRTRSPRNHTSHRFNSDSTPGSSKPVTPFRSPSNSTTILSLRNTATLSTLFKQPLKRKTGSSETINDILPSVHRKSRSKKHSKIGVDTSYLRRLIEQQEEDQNRRFKEPGDARRLFRKIARRAMICMQWVCSVLKLRDNFLEQQLEEFNDKSKEIEQALYDKQMEMAGTVFNKHDFMPKHEFSLEKDVRDILTVPANHRTKDQIRRAMAALQGIRSFTEFPTHVQHKLCQVAWYQRVPAKKVIIRQGHQGLNFYFVVSGRGIIKVIRRRADGTIMNGERVVFKVEKGHSFGDIALLHNVERTATVESHTDMSLLVIGRDDFVRIFLQRDSQEGFQPAHISFLKTLPFLKHWPMDKLIHAGDNLIFHYFKRGKLIVADNNSSDYLYIIKSGTCEVLKQLKEVQARTSVQMAKIRRKQTAIEIAKKPGIGANPTATVPRSFSLPDIPNKIIDIDLEAELERTVTGFVKARHDDPNLMVDIPNILYGRLDKAQRELNKLGQIQYDTPILASVVTEMLEKKRLSLFFTNRKESIPEDKVVEPSRVPSAKLTRNESRSVRQDRAGLRLLSSPSSAAQTAKEDKSLRRSSIVNTDDDAYREEYRDKLVHRQNSLAPFSLSLNDLSKIPKVEITKDGTEVKKPVNKFLIKKNDGFSQSKMQHMCTIWRKSAQKSSDIKFKVNKSKELKVAKQVTASPQRLLGLPNERRPSYSSVPQFDEGVAESSEQLMISHEGKQQNVPHQAKQLSNSAASKAVFVRLALLRPKDVFGLETINFDDNFETTNTSVCLVSGGAEVLMINKQFFLENCTSENLEHLRNVVAPYPMESTMQDNLQVSVDWQVFSQQQMDGALHRLEEKRYQR